MRKNNSIFFILSFLLKIKKKKKKENIYIYKYFKNNIKEKKYEWEIEKIFKK
jgi:hypothetical protein